MTSGNTNKCNKVNQNMQYKIESTGSNHAISAAARLTPTMNCRTELISSAEMLFICQARSEEQCQTENSGGKEPWHLIQMRWRTWIAYAVPPFCTSFEIL